MNAPPNPLRYLPLFAAIFATTPLAVDMYLPAMPGMVEAFNTDFGLVQSTLSIYLLGFASGMFFSGPLADHFGRRWFLVGGLIGFIINSIALAQCETIDNFLLFRFFQAFCGGSASVVIPGAIRQLFGDKTAKGLAYVSMTMMVAPMVAPFVGSLILEAYNWPVIFWVLAIYALIVLSWTGLQFPFHISGPRSHEPLIKSIVHNYRVVFSNRRCYAFLFCAMTTSFAFFTYLTSVSFVYMSVYELSERTFGYLFAVNVGALMLGNLINARFNGRFSAIFLLRIALVFTTIASIGLFTVTWFDFSLTLLVITLSLMMSGMMVMSTNSDALVLMCFGKQPGTATAVLGILRFGFGALAGPLLAVFHDGSAVPFAGIMLACIIAIGIVQFWVKWKGYEPQPDQS